jgi:hypothetical protein
MNLERIRMHVGLESINIELSGLLQISHMRITRGRAISLYIATKPSTTRHADLIPLRQDRR